MPFFNTIPIDLQDILQLTLSQQYVLAGGVAILHTRPRTHAGVFAIKCHNSMATELSARYGNAIQV